MNNFNFTGRTLPTTGTNLKTVNDVANYIASLPRMTYANLLEEIAKVLAAIGDECLDPNKVEGRFNFNDGTTLPRWGILPGKSPFHIIDPITKKSVPDPRVIYIGEFAHAVGCSNEHDIEGGLSYMHILYYATEKHFHSYIGDLKWAWDGIGLWRP